MHRALKLTAKHLFCIKIMPLQSQLNADLFNKSCPSTVIKWKQRIINEQSARVSKAKCGSIGPILMLVFSLLQVANKYIVSSSFKLHERGEHCCSHGLHS